MTNNLGTTALTVGPVSPALEGLASPSVDPMHAFDMEAHDFWTQQQMLVNDFHYPDMPDPRTATLGEMIEWSTERTKQASRMQTSLSAIETAAAGVRKTTETLLNQK